MTAWVLRWGLLGSVLLSVGCFGPDSSPGSGDGSAAAQESPAVQARAELMALRAQIRAAAGTESAALRVAGSRLAEEDPSTRAATALVIELHRSVSAPPLRIDGALAASSPSLAARVRELRAALQAHHDLLSDLHIVPLPSISGELDLDQAPDPALVEAAIQVEEATGGRWPLKRIFVAYSLELEAIREEATALAACTDACPAGVAEQAVPVLREAERLAALLEDFAALYC